MFKNAFFMHEVAIKDGVLNASDDIQLAKRLSLNVAFAKGSRRNVKITTLEDIYLLESYLRK
jgi:2-C-methyl-D-erythritol 4-phosphate cytidylyltransferase